MRIFKQDKWIATYKNKKRSDFDIEVFQKARGKYKNLFVGRGKTYKGITAIGCGSRVAADAALDRLQQVGEDYLQHFKRA